MQWWIILIIVVAVLVLYVISTYNRLVKARNKVRDQWAQIDVQLKRRYDLIPNIVETVKGYAKHEKEALEAVIAARSKALSATTPEDEMKADGDVSRALSKLLALTESYPELKANENFLKLQDSLSETEDKIAYSRQFYNDNAKSYRNLVEMFPSNIVAKLFRFEPMAFFEASAEEKAAPKVQF
nr:LemA family protein [Bacilli bacterium]